MTPLENQESIKFYSAADVILGIEKMAEDSDYLFNVVNHVVKTRDTEEIPRLKEVLNIELAEHTSLSRWTKTLKQDSANLDVKTLDILTTRIEEAHQLYKELLSLTGEIVEILGDRHASRKDMDKMLMIRDKDLFGDIANRGSVGKVKLFSKQLANIQSQIRLSMQQRQNDLALRREGIRDTLTQLPNRKAFDNVCSVFDTQGKSLPVSILMFDVDHFKKVNDTYGHLVGDEVLKEVARLVAANVRTINPANPMERMESSQDQGINAVFICRENITQENAFRFGGEEIVGIVPGEKKSGEVVAERVRKAISDRFKSPIEVDGKNFNVQVTLSVGVAHRSHNSQEKLRAVLEEADRCVYRAKASGRDRVCISENENSSPER